MFRVTIPTHIEIGVTVRAPGGPEGRIRIRMRYLATMDEREAYLKRIAEQRMTDPQVLDEVLVGWSDIADQDGAPIPFEDVEARARVLQIEYVYFAVRDAVIDELARGRAAEKN